jgi:hypothetical protein
MTARNFLFAAITLAAVIFAGANLAGRKPWIALAALLVGLAWLLLEVYRRAYLASLFFTLFLAAAVLASVDQVPPLLVLLGLVASLAAWDLSRFLARVRRAAAAGAGPGLERRHLRKLALTLAAGYAAAALPLLFRLSLSFAALSAVALLAVIALRRAILALRRPAGQGNDSNLNIPNGKTRP